MSRLHAQSSVNSSAAQRGFTLLELLIVLIVLGVLVGVAGIPASSSGEDALAQAELYVRDALRTAREQAFNSRRSHGVAFDAANERFIVLAADGSAVLDPLSKAAYVVDFRAPSMPRGVEISAVDFGLAGSAALFDGQGDPLAGGSVTLVAGDATLVVSLDAATGLVSSL